MIAWLTTPMLVSYGQVLVAGVVLVGLVGVAGWLALCWHSEAIETAKQRKVADQLSGLVELTTTRLRACDELLLRREHSRQTQPPH